MKCERIVCVVCIVNYPFFVVLATVAILGGMFGAAWTDVVVLYEVTTYNLYCTALYVDQLEGASRLTPLPARYAVYEFDSGVPMRIQVLESRAPEIVQSLLERPLVYSVQRISLAGNGSDWPLEINHNATSGFDYCYSNVGYGEQEIYKSLAKMDTSLAAASDSTKSLGFTTLDGGPEMSSWILRANNATSMMAYLKDKGTEVKFEGFPREGVAQLRVHMPVFIIPELTEREDFRSMKPVVMPIHVDHGTGKTHTEGLDEHERTVRWHDAGYNGTGVRVGVIDVEFGGIMASVMNDEIPTPIRISCGGEQYSCCM